MNFSILTSYSFLTVAFGTMLLSIPAGALGCITVLKGESLIGDAIGHSSFPGIILAFMLFSTRNSEVLMLGALFSGSLAFILIILISSNSKVDLDACLAVVLSSFFGLGMVLKSYIQGNPIYQKTSQAGIQNYIFGQASYIVKSDIYVILLVSIISLLLIAIFYKEIKVFVFDEVYARTIGISSKFLNGVILFSTMSVIATGLKLVGAILISSLLIVPAITALSWSNKFSKVLIIAAFCGAFSSFVGTYISTAYKGMSTGPSIILIMTIIAFISLLIGPRGFIFNMIRRRRSL